MNEAQRQSYLRAMGITQWVPSADLSSWQVESATLQGDMPIPRAATEVPLAVVSSPAMPEETPAPQQVTANEDQQPTPAIAPPPPIAPNQPTPRFQLLLAGLTGDIAIADLCTLNMGHQRAHQQLAANILFALGRRAQLNFDQMQWPVANSPHIDSSAEAAQRAARAFGTSVQGRYQYRQLLCFSSAESYLGQIPNVETIYLPGSLSELLQHPRAKALVWRAIKRLKITLA